MINALDHVSVRASFRAGAIGAYEILLGRKAQDGMIRVANGGLGIEDHDSSAGPGWLVFATDSLDRAARLLERRAITAERRSDRLELPLDATHRVPIALVERGEVPPASPLLKSDEASSVSALDHVVVRTANPERAIALYAGRLGFDLRLDRGNPEWGSRLLFFRCGDLVVELAHDLKRGVSDAPDRLWGLSWRTPDIARAHARLKKAGVEVSDVRDGRRPGTKVFGVMSHTANVPTIVIGGRQHW